LVTKGTVKKKVKHPFGMLNNGIAKKSVPVKRGDTLLSGEPGFDDEVSTCDLLSERNCCKEYQ